MRRTAIALSLAAIVVTLHGCAADAPTKPPTGGGGTPSSAIQVQLVASDTNPRAGSCTLITAIVTLNGVQAPNGTGVTFSTNFGTFSQTGTPVVSVDTTDGGATTALCGPGAGPATVKATVTLQNKTGSATLTIRFQADSSTLPFVSSCNPSLGSKNGGDSITLNGGRFFGTPSTSRVQFTANGVTKDGVVTALTASTITVLTPGFPELAAANTPATVTLTLGTYLPSPVVLTLPACFSYGTVDSGTPNITALLPSSGKNEGNTRVTIIGSGFSTHGVQVFFGAVEASVISTTFNQVVVLSPPAFGAGAGNLNQPVSVTVKNIDDGVVSNGVTYRYTPAIQLTAISNNNIQTVGFLQPVTIYGQGFEAPVYVGLAGVTATVQHVSATELIVLPGLPLVDSCANIGGAVSVTNINSGESASGLSFLYVVPKLTIDSVAPPGRRSRDRSHGHDHRDRVPDHPGRRHRAVRDQGRFRAERHREQRRRRGSAGNHHDLPGMRQRQPGRHQPGRRHGGRLGHESGDDVHGGRVQGIQLPAAMRRSHSHAGRTIRKFSRPLRGAALRCHRG